MKSRNELLAGLQNEVRRLESEFVQITPERKMELLRLSDYIQKHIALSQPVALTFICTHNSRRSHIAQVWALAAAHYYSVPGISSFSGGTEVTALSPRAAEALRIAGFQVKKKLDGDNPEYDVAFAESARHAKLFSKKYEHPANPSRDFVAVMTCSKAEADCPVVLGATLRIAIPYTDPKDFDGTPEESARYTDTVRQIGREMLYIFSQVKSRKTRISL